MVALLKDSQWATWPVHWLSAMVSVAATAAACRHAAALRSIFDHVLHFQPAQGCGVADVCRDMRHLLCMHWHGICAQPGEVHSKLPATTCIQAMYYTPAPAPAALID